MQVLQGQRGRHCPTCHRRAMLQPQRRCILAVPRRSAIGAAAAAAAGLARVVLAALQAQAPAVARDVAAAAAAADPHSAAVLTTAMRMRTAATAALTVTAADCHSLHHPGKCHARPGAMIQAMVPVLALLPVLAVRLGALATATRMPLRHRRRHCLHRRYRHSLHCRIPSRARCCVRACLGILPPPLQHTQDSDSGSEQGEDPELAQQLPIFCARWKETLPVDLAAQADGPVPLLQRLTVAQMGLASVHERQLHPGRLCARWLSWLQESASWSCCRRCGAATTMYPWPWPGETIAAIPMTKMMTTAMASTRRLQLQPGSHLVPHLLRTRVRCAVVIVRAAAATAAAATMSTLNRVSPPVTLSLSQLPTSLRSCPSRHCYESLHHWSVQRRSHNRSLQLLHRVGLRLLPELLRLRLQRIVARQRKLALSFRLRLSESAELPVLQQQQQQLEARCTAAARRSPSPPCQCRLPPAAGQRKRRLPLQRALQRSSQRGQPASAPRTAPTWAPASASASARPPRPLTVLLCMNQ